MNYKLGSRLNTASPSCAQITLKPASAPHVASVPYFLLPATACCVFLSTHVRQMGVYKVVVGDILEVYADVIVQQTNCLTRKARGLSAAIAQKYPYAHVYKRRPVTHDKMGDVVLCHPNEAMGGPVVACLMAQYCPGPPGKYNQMYSIHTNKDNAVARVRAFRTCLSRLSTLCVEQNLRVIAVPCGIGCGLAGGAMKDYVPMLEAFATNLPKGFEVHVVQLKK